MALSIIRMTLGVSAAMSVLGVGAAQAEDLTLWTISFSANAANAAFEKAEAEFEAAHPDVDVKIVQRGVDEHKSALRIAAGADKGPDIYFSWAGLGLGGEYVMAGLSEPLDRYYEQYGWDETFLPAAMSFADQYEGGRHGVPFTFKGEAVYYNTGLFEEAGIESEPQTYEELLAVAEKLKEAGIPAFTFGGTVNWHLMRLMDVILETKCGAEVHDQLMAMKANWTETACAAESFGELQMWAENYILSPFMGIDQAQSVNLFASDRAAMMVEGDWLVNQLGDLTDVEKYGLFRFPTGNDRLYGFSEYHYISAKSDKQDLAAEFLDFFNGQEFQQDVLGTFGTVSINTEVDYPDDLPPLKKEWLEIFENSPATFVNGDQAFPLDVTTEYFRVINEVATGNMAPEAAAEDLQTFIDDRG